MAATPTSAIAIGATDIVEARGEEGVGKMKELHGGLCADSMIEAVGMQVVDDRHHRAYRAGGHVGYVGALDDVSLDGTAAVLASTSTPPARCAASASAHQLIWTQDRPGKVFDLTLR